MTRDRAETPQTRFAPGRGARLLLVTLPTMLFAATLWGIGEIVVRYHERHRATVPGTMPSLYYRQIPLGHALVHDYDYFGWVHTNAQGFRGSRRVTPDKPPATTRIIAVGGSTTFDTEVSADSAAWPARLERLLNDLLPGQAVEVINAGVAGYGMQHDLLRLETELYAYHPDLIILYQGHNDLDHELRHATGVDDALDPQRPDEVPTVTPWIRWLEGHSLLYVKLRERYLAIRFARRASRANQKPSIATASLIEPGAQNFERRVRNYLAVARALDIPVVVPEVVQVSGGATHDTDPERVARWRHAMPFAPTDTVLAGYARYNAVLKSVTNAYGVPFIPMVESGIAGANYYSFNDPIHFNDRGADRFARALAAQLIQRHLIPPEALGVTGVSRDTRSDLAARP
ncbi:MAG TPA: GDSL-type esterase/lipase family protein [Gemmatimonadaceae bacterium]|jgi:lysophospholipase L1-like esterase|nr:GDSL-type esterase/lipase family protein [Gemmatimonadaceae bacterium]